MKKSLAFLIASGFAGVVSASSLGSSGNSAQIIALLTSMNQQLQTMNQALQTISTNQSQLQAQLATYKQTDLQLAYPAVPFPGWRSVLGQVSASGEAMYDQGFYQSINQSFQNSNGTFSNSDLVSLKKRIVGSSLSVLENGQASEGSSDLSSKIQSYASLNAGAMSGVQAQRAMYQLLALNTEVMYASYAQQKELGMLITNLILLEGLNSSSGVKP